MRAKPGMEDAIGPLVIPPNSVIDIGLTRTTPGCTDLPPNSIFATLTDGPIPQNVLINPTSKIESGILQGTLRKYRHTVVMGDVMDEAVEVEGILNVVFVFDMDLKQTRVARFRIQI